MTFENMFFLKTKSTIEYDDPIIEMEDYERVDSWDEEGNVTESTTCQRLKSSTPNTSTRQAYIVNYTVPEDYQHCLEETYEGEDEEGNIIQLVDPQCIKIETRQRQVPRTLELDYTVVVGHWKNKDVIHIVSSNLDLKTDLDYLCNEYRKMKDVHQDLHDEVHETIYEVDEEDPETHIVGKVTKREKTKSYKGKGSPMTKKRENVKPHRYAGVDIN